MSHSISDCGFCSCYYFYTYAASHYSDKMYFVHLNYLADRLRVDDIGDIRALALAHSGTMVPDERHDFRDCMCTDGDDVCHMAPRI